MSNKKETIDLKNVMVSVLNKYSFKDFINLGNVIKGTMSIDGKPLTEEELKAVTAFVRLMRNENL